jgi:hypothetical protein
MVAAQLSITSKSSYSCSV